jgi:hypothetical protein
MRDIAARLERLEGALSAVGCTCAPVIVLFAHADNPLSPKEIAAQAATRSTCGVHAEPTGQLVIIRSFGVAPLGPTGIAPMKRP